MLTINTKKTICLAIALVAMMLLGVLGEEKKASAAETENENDTGSITVTVGAANTAAGGTSVIGNPEAVPEPITGLILATGLGGVVLKRAKDKSKKN